MRRWGALVWPAVTVAALCLTSCTVPTGAATSAGGQVLSGLLRAGHGSTTCPSTPRSRGWVRRENARAGATGWRPPSVDAGPVVGYLTSSSLGCGDRLAVHLEGPAGPVRLAVYRVGWYGGAGARLVAQRGGVRVVPRPVTPAAAHRTAAESWPVSATLPVTSDWVPGFYLLDVVGPRGIDEAIPFVVRDPLAVAPTVVMVSLLTWYAYDNWGGVSLYGGHGGTTALRFDHRAYVASTNRPLTGPGMLQLLERDLPVVTEVERVGLDAAYVTDLDVHLHPSLLAGRADVVVPGHSEYWTWQMFSAVKAARDTGTNLAFLGANTIFWQARVSRDRAGAPTLITVYRRTWLDPLGRTRLATVQWSDPPVLRSGAQLDAAAYTGRASPAGVRVLSAPPWLFAGSGLRPGSLVPDLGFNEYDHLLPHDPGQPDGVQPLMAGLVRMYDGRYRLMTSEYYVAPSGAGVFVAGTTGWACDLQGWCAEGKPSAEAVRLVRLVTGRLLSAFSVPRAGLRHPAEPAPPPSVPALLGAVPPGFIARGGIPA